MFLFSLFFQYDFEDVGQREYRLEIEKGNSKNGPLNKLADKRVNGSILVGD